ncbi:hypothetical protein [Moritella sp. F3]|uniref:hypothetical protein n=1 Tax=Moritella sp. F3 TaxID=2718882 RepID=UPI0018E16D32|nr:hypothetical protein [Moritella sp. F3]GIC77672.1 hypothetical protein FMO001_23990 [Moritella sp. F1]GIC82085.1 hypothetical protein FMO003_23660 [Moritella sp. F3]
MQIPLLSTDLPNNFNKVAKYIGRHWPTGKIGLNNSRETLAYLLGYNSVHEVNRVALTRSLPPQIQLKEVHSSILGRALYKYGVRPNEMIDLIQRAPLKELAFYDVTDKARVQRMHAKHRGAGMFYNIDEMHLINSYESPRLIIEQHKQKLLPPYTYAVNSDGQIFDSNDYESVLNKLGDIDALVAELGTEITVPEFITTHILPLVWVPLNDFILYTDCKQTNWNTPEHIVVYHIKNTCGLHGWVLFNQGVKAYYPTLFKTVTSVTEALKSIYLNEIILGGEFIDGEFDLTWASKVEISSSEYESWHTIDFNNAELISVSDQSYLRPNRVHGYSEIHNHTIISVLPWQKTPAEVITGGVIPQVTIDEHSTITHSKQAVLEFAKGKLEQGLSLEKLLLSIFDGFKLDINTLINRESGDHDDADADADIDPDNLEDWTTLGALVEKYHPEIITAFETPVIGYIFKDYKEFVHGDRFTCSCNSRDVVFLGYLLSYLPGYKSNCNSDDIALAGTIALALVPNNEKGSVEGLFKDVLRLLKRHSSQNSDICDIIKHSKRIASKDAAYITHGNLVHYQERSNNEMLGEMARRGRKYNSGILTQYQSNKVL